MIRPLASLATLAIAIGALAQAAEFDRQTFLAAVKDRLKSQNNLMESRSDFDPLWNLDDPRTEWQKDIVAIPELRMIPTGQKASFGLAVAYLASEESRVPFLVNRPGQQMQGLARMDGVSFALHPVFRHFGQELLRAMFNETQACSSQGFLHYGPSELEFATSICNDLKRVVAEARQEYHESQILISEKRNARAGVQRTRELLKQAKGYDNQLVVETNIRNLESSLAGDNVKEIRARAQGLTTANRDLQQFLTEQKAQAEALLNARQAANEELTRTPILLTQAQGYGKQNQVASAQKPLELALAGENADEIKSKTQALVAVNRDLDQYIQDAKAAAEKKRQQENQARVFVATKQRAEKAIGSATAAVTGAAKYSGDKEIATASRSTAQTMNELSAKARTADPRDEPQISKLTERLGAEQSRLSAMTRQTVVLNSSLGRRVYEGCSGWAKRKGMITSAPVRFFKDDATNQAADLATNMGTHLCRCMTVEIAGDTEITDQAKLEITRQFETRDRMDNQALAVVVGASFIKCQAQITDELSGGRLSGR